MTSSRVHKRLVLLLVLVVGGATAMLQPSQRREPETSIDFKPNDTPKTSSMLTKREQASYPNVETSSLSPDTKDENLNGKKKPIDSSSVKSDPSNVAINLEENLVGVDVTHSKEANDKHTSEKSVDRFLNLSDDTSQSTTISTENSPTPMPEAATISENTSESDLTKTTAYLTERGSTAQSGNEPKSGPSPGGFGPIEDILPVVFPRPVGSGRENFEPLPSLDRKTVNHHFDEKKNLRDIALQKQNNFVDEIVAKKPTETSRDGREFDVLVRTPKPGKKPMLMKLTPKALSNNAGKKLFLNSHGDLRHIHHTFSDSARIGVEAKGDHGQIKRIPGSHSDDHSLHQIHEHHIAHEEYLHPNLGHIPPHTDFLVPHFADQHSNLIHQSHLNNVFVTPAPNVVAVTTSAHGLLGHNPFGFAPRQLPAFGQDPTIYHRPTAIPPRFDNGQVYIEDQHQHISSDHRRPLTRDHFLNLQDQHLSSFVTPREPNQKLPFGHEFYGGGSQIDSNVYVERPASVPAFSVTGRPLIEHHFDNHFVSHPHGDSSNSFALRPASPRPTTLHDSLNPSTFYNFVASTPSQKFHSESGLVRHSTVGTANSVIYNTTPRPFNVIHDHSPTPSSLEYLPKLPSPGISATTFRPSYGPILSSTPRPFITSTPGPSFIETKHSIVKGPHSGSRGASRYRPPTQQNIFQKPHIQTKFETVPSGHTDYSSQYHSGEHLSHHHSQKRPWVASDQDNSLDSDEKEYTYHYSVHSPSTGDHKAAHERKLPDGTVVGGYSLLQPDGITRKVSYTADKYSGFQANVEYIPPRPKLSGK